MNAHIYDYPRPALTTDCVILRLRGKVLSVLLIERRNPPFQGCWAFPGGFVDEWETAEDGAMRELREETGLSGIRLNQFHAFSRPGRDPRGWTVTIAFYGCLGNDDSMHPVGADDAVRACWFPVDALPPLAFDHREILDTALMSLRRDVFALPVAFDLLDATFTQSDVESLFFCLFGRADGASEWLQHLLRSGFVVPRATEKPSYVFQCQLYEQSAWSVPAIFF